MTPDSDLTRLIATLQAPSGETTVGLVVQRLPGEKRATPPTITLDPLHGVVGDRWSLKNPNPEAMVTLMRWDVADVLARRAGVPIAILGDNVFATIDTSTSNLPPGTVLEVGGATCVVTPKPHTGCSKFSARVGADAWALTREARWVPTQLRGVHLRVLVGGDVSVGDRIRVIFRPSSAEPA